MKPDTAKTAFALLVKADQRRLDGYPGEATMLEAQARQILGAAVDEEEHSTLPPPMMYRGRVL